MDGSPSSDGGSLPRFKVEKGLDSPLVIASLRWELFLLFLLLSLPLSLFNVTLGFITGSVTGFLGEAVGETLLFVLLLFLQGRLSPGEGERIIRSLSAPKGVKVRSRSWRALSYPGPLTITFTTTSDKSDSNSSAL